MNRTVASMPNDMRQSHTCVNFRGHVCIRP